MQASVLTTVVLPLALLIIMLGMGLSLSVQDFRQVLRAPKAVLVDILCQMILLPILGYALVVGMGLPAELGMGLIILALCPGGTTSNMITFLSRGDVALSISLTAVVSLVTPFTIPLVAGLAMTQLMGEAGAISLPFVRTVATLLGITVVPVAIGMGIKRRWPAFANRTQKPVQVLSIVFLALIIAGIVKQNWAMLPTAIVDIGPAALALNLLSMAAGFGVSRALRLSRAESVAITVEVGIQNGTTALFVASTVLGSATMAIAPAIYSLVMFATGAAFGVLVNAVWTPTEDPNTVLETAGA